MRDRELQAENMEPKLPDDVTPVTLNAGTLGREVQPKNIYDIFVTVAVLNNGTVVRETQLPPNILNIVLTD